MSHDDNSAQRDSPTYRLPALDEAFILGDEQRGLRLQLEYGKAEQALRAWGVRSTIVVFGSARVRSAGQLDAAAAAMTNGHARDRAAGRPAVPPLATGSTFEASRVPGAEPLLRAQRPATPEQRARWDRWYGEARRFARIASERGGALTRDHGPRDHVIATGGGPGIMEAANRGATDAGAPSIGFNVSLPREQQPNAWSTPELTFRFHYFAMRKLHFAMRARALVAFPGGFGTFDELFEVLTLCQTRKMTRVPILLFDRDWWTRIIDFRALADEGVIDPADLDLITFAEDAESAWQALLDAGLTVPAQT